MGEKLGGFEAPPSEGLGSKERVKLEKRLQLENKDFWDAAFQEANRVLERIDKNLFRYRDKFLSKASVRRTAGLSVAADDSRIELKFAKGGPMVMMTPEPLQAELNQYRDVIEQLQAVPTRQLDEDRKFQLLKNLDERRRALHDRGAEHVSAILEDQEVASTPDDRRALFEALAIIDYYKRYQLKHFDSDVWTESDLLDGIDLVALKKKILEKTGVRVDIDYVVWGGHADDPHAQYSVRTLNVINGQKIKEIEDVIDQEVADKGNA